jgi:hypothetical protein
MADDQEPEELPPALKALGAMITMQVINDLKGEQTMTHEKQIENLRAALIAAELRAVAAAKGITDAGILDDMSLHEKHFTVTEDFQVKHKDGFSPASWLDAQRETRPHWFQAPEQAKNDKSQNLTANNPWTADFWNKTEQGKVYSKDPAQAEALARAAGVNVFAAHPKRAA